MRHPGLLFKSQEPRRAGRWAKGSGSPHRSAGAGALAAHNALEDGVCLPLFLHLRDVGAALAGEEDLRDPLVQAGAVEARPKRLTNAERAAAALLLAANQRWEKVRLPAEDCDELVWSPRLAQLLAQLTLFHREQSDEIAPLMCLDGWDECAEHHKLLGSALRDYSESTRARIFLTSRIVGYACIPGATLTKSDDPAAY